MRITLQEPVTISNIQNTTTRVVNDELVVARIVDRPEDKIIRVFFKGFEFPIELWSGSEYDAIGQWTDDDVVNKIKTLYNIQ